MDDTPPRRLPVKRSAPRGMRIRRIAVAIVVLAMIYWLRPLLHPFLFRFYAAPIVWLLPLLIFLGGAAASILVFRRRPQVEVLDGPPTGFTAMLPPNHPLRRAADRLGKAAGMFFATVGLAFAAFFVLGILNGPLVAVQLYKNTVFEPIKDLPPIGAVRLTPKEVGERVAGSGFNSPTEHLTDFHLIKRKGHLTWTALRTPESAYRSFTQRTTGLLELNASASTRDTELIDGEFKTAPGMYLTDNLRWRLLKKRFFVELDDPIAITDLLDRPLIVVPYVKYSGWLIRRPVFGGVFVVHPDGKIEDLTPAEATRREEIANAGRAFPESLARRMQESYAYKNGLLNKWFSHEDQTQISRTENNPQPYLLDFKERGLQFVSSAEPYGRAFAVNAIFLTDSLNGRTRMWQPERGADLTGNRRVLETVRSLSIPGIVFAETGNTAPGDRGGFRVVEPRPMVVEGRLVFMTSIIPDNANNVSKTVFIDAATNRVAAIFDNDSDPRADAKVARYLAGGEAPGAEVGNAVGGADGGTGATGADNAADGSGAGTTGGGGASGATDGDGSTSATGDQRKKLDELIRRQRELLDELEALRRQMDE